MSATMDFFGHQEAARRQTKVLVLLFALAMAAIIATVFLLVSAVLGYTEAEEPGGGLFFWDWRILLATAVGISLVVTLGSAYKVSSLRAGGHTVAEMLDGRRIDQDTHDPHERKVLNVVEEMAVASGTPVPPVYILEGERGINAFAAGYAPGDAVIGITRGSVEKLTREELQGVIAHEFSHILNGDMRLNIRLIGLVHGILVIGLIGWIVLRSSAISGSSRRRRGGNQAPILLLGLGLLIIGFIGTFFESLIKAAVSRQREYLADASAVQFTRNPKGIASALKKIGGLLRGSRLESTRAAEVSHMLFGQGFRVGFQALFATHPPLVERVRRIEPAFPGRFASVAEDFEVDDRAELAAAAGFAGAPGTVGPPSPRAAVATVGQPNEAHLAQARAVIERVPERLRRAVHKAYSARAVIFALVLDADRGARKRQLERLARHADAAVYQETLDLQNLVDQVPPEARLALIDLSLPALREMAPPQYEAFRENVDALIQADEKIDLFEWSLRRIVVHHLDPVFREERPRGVRHRSLAALRDDCARLLSTLAYAGHTEADAARSAFREAASELDLTERDLVPVERLSLESLDQALDALEAALPRIRRKVLAACATSITADREVTPREGELFRAIGESLGCPVPPLLSGEPIRA